MNVFHLAVYFDWNCFEWDCLAWKIASSDFVCWADCLRSYYYYYCYCCYYWRLSHQSIRYLFLDHRNILKTFFEKWAVFAVMPLETAKENERLDVSDAIHCSPLKMQSSAENRTRILNAVYLRKKNKIKSLIAPAGIFHNGIWKIDRFISKWKPTDATILLDV